MIRPSGIKEERLVLDALNNVFTCGQSSGENLGKSSAFSVSKEKLEKYTCGHLLILLSLPSCFFSWKR